MSDSISVLTASGQVYADKCQLVGLIVTCTAPGGGQAVLDDSKDGSGTPLLAVRASAYSPVILFLQERFFPLFSTGMYLTLGGSMTAILWVRRL